MTAAMTRSFLAKYVSPWALKRDRELKQRLATLRQRDGDHCRRCRRPLRFDLPEGHDQAPTIQELVPASNDEPPALENLVLCHRRCNAQGADNTGEVKERIRRKGEAALFSKSRSRSRKAG
jgi:5-methylcytosine-specific restriction endonuclease McrA